MRLVRDPAASLRVVAPSARVFAPSSERVFSSSAPALRAREIACLVFSPEFAVLAVCVTACVASVIAVPPMYGCDRQLPSSPTRDVSACAGIPPVPDTVLEREVLLYKTVKMVEVAHGAVTPSRAVVQSPLAALDHTRGPSLDLRHHFVPLDAF